MPSVNMWYVTEEFIDGTWQVIRHYRDYMKAHNAMRNFERQDCPTRPSRVSHIYEYEALVEGKPRRVFTRDLLQPDVIKELNTDSLSVKDLEILNAVDILPPLDNDA